MPRCIHMPGTPSCTALASNDFPARDAPLRITICPISAIRATSHEGGYLRQAPAQLRECEGRDIPTQPCRARACLETRGFKQALVRGDLVRFSRLELVDPRPAAMRRRASATPIPAQLLASTTARPQA